MECMNCREDPCECDNKDTICDIEGCTNSIFVRFFDCGKNAQELCEKHFEEAWENRVPASSLTIVERLNRHRGQWNWLKGMCALSPYTDKKIRLYRDVSATANDDGFVGVFEETGGDASISLVHYPDTTDAGTIELLIEEVRKVSGYPEWHLRCTDDGEWYFTWSLDGTPGKLYKNRQDALLDGMDMYL